MSITIKDIARESGYAVGTVSRVLNNSPDVSEKARRKINEVVKKYNFQLNSNAKLLRQHPAKSVALIVKGTQNMLFGAMVEMVQKELAAKGYDCLTYYINREENEMVEAIKICNERRPLGILFVGSRHIYFREGFDKIDVPCVMVTNTAKELNFKYLSSVSTDDVDASRAMIDYLVQIGHKNIGVIGGDPANSKPTEYRLKGCRQSFDKHGIEFDITADFEITTFNAMGGYLAANRLLDKNPDITAIFAMSDVLAMGAIRAIADRGMTVPGDISVAGFDGIEMARFTVPKLTTIKQNGEEISRRSVEILVDNIENSAPAINEFIPFHIISGESTKQYIPD